MEINIKSAETSSDQKIFCAQVGKSESLFNFENSNLSVSQEAENLEMTVDCTSDTTVDEQQDKEAKVDASIDQILSPESASPDLQSDTPKDSETPIAVPSNLAPQNHPTIDSLVTRSFLSSAFSMPAMNPLLSTTLPSPFLTPNIFFNPHISSPVLEGVLRNSWMINAYNRWNSELPSSGLPLPTPTFQELTPAPPLYDSPANVIAADLSIQAAKTESSSGVTAVTSSKSSQGGDVNGTEGGVSSQTQHGGDVFRVRWRDHGAKICAHVSSLHAQSQSADMHFVAKGGVKVPAHRLVMASASPMLRALLKDLNEDSTAVVLVPNTAAEALQALVLLCYTGKTTVSEALVKPVQKVAEELEIRCLHSDGSADPKIKLERRYPPSPPSIFTFPPAAHNLSLSSTSVHNSSTADLGSTSGLKRSCTPEGPSAFPESAKKIRTGTTFLPEEVHCSSTSYRPAGTSQQKKASSSITAQSSSSTSSSPSFSSPNTPRDLTPSNLTHRSGSISGGSVGSRVLLWKFLLQLLHDDRFSPVYIRWLDRSTGVFRIMESDMVAQLWGLARKNTNMNYEKMSRGMRTYYKRGILYHIDGTKLIYKFNTSESEVQHYMQLFHRHHTMDTSLLADGVLSATSLSFLADSKIEQNRKKVEGNKQEATLLSDFQAPSMKTSSNCGSSKDKLDLDLNKQGTLGVLPTQVTCSSRSSMSNPPTLLPSYNGHSVYTPAYPCKLEPNEDRLTCKRMSDAFSTHSSSSKSSSLNSKAFETPQKRASPFEYLYTNKPRSNSIPNFQTNSHFTSFLNSQKISDNVNIKEECPSFNENTSDSM